MFCEKTTIIILNQLNIKKKSTKIILEKIIKKHKNHVGEYCNNQQCFKEKNYKAKFLTISKLKKINSTKIILEKKTCGKTL